MTLPAPHHKKPVIQSRSFSRVAGHNGIVFIIALTGFAAVIIIVLAGLAEPAHQLVKHKRLSCPGDSHIQQVSLILALPARSGSVMSVKSSLSITTGHSRPLLRCAVETVT